ncbi:rbcL, partial [Symbiodinium sp. CCMP2456]
MTALGLDFVVPRHAVGKPSASSHATVDARIQSANFTRGSTAMYGVAVLATAAAGLIARAKRSRIAARAQPSHGRKFEYSMQKDSHADYEFINE